MIRTVPISKHLICLSLLLLDGPSIFMFVITSEGCFPPCAVYTQLFLIVCNLPNFYLPLSSPPPPSFSSCLCFWLNFYSQSNLGLLLQNHHMVQQQAFSLDRSVFLLMCVCTRVLSFIGVSSLSAAIGLATSAPVCSFALGPAAAV